MISIDEITRIAEKRNQLKKETYTKIYEQISKKIRQSVDLGHKYLFCQIPSFVMGYPHFNRAKALQYINCLLYTSPSPRDRQKSRMPSSA